MRAHPAGEAAWPAVDAALRDAGGRLPAAPLEGSPPVGAERGAPPWLLAQTLASGPSRRALYGVLGLEVGLRLLDVGTGFGPVAVEAAAGYGCQAVGVDVDPGVLAEARRVAAALVAEGWLADPPGRSGGPHGAEGGVASTRSGTVRFATAAADRLPFGTGSFDVVTARFLLQHLARPEVALADMARVLAPGGLLAVVDVDDALSFSHPEPPEAVRRLTRAYQAAQEARGGDRRIGRKLAGMVDACGLEVTAVLVLPQAAYGTEQPHDAGRQVLVSRLVAFADELVDRGLLTATEVRAGLDWLATEAHGPATVFDGHVAVLGRRRERGPGTPARPPAPRAAG